MFSLHNQIVLGSNSPRRKDLLSLAGIKHDVWRIEYEETLPQHSLSPEKVPMYFAEQKAFSVKEKLKDELLITADTLVFLNDRILGKPKDRDDAFEMLQSLSGKMHKVITGVCMMTENGHILFSDTTKVFFKAFDLKELEFYLDNYNPMDKAGSYGAQDWLGLVGIEKIEGSYFNVMGLPVHLIYEELKYLDNHQHFRSEVSNI